MKVNAIYQPSFGQYRGNPLIEALPPIRNFNDIKTALKCTVDISPLEKHEPGVVRSHLISQLMNSFFLPISRHYSLEQKLGIMIRDGYVARNLEKGELATHLQNGYERIMTGDIHAFRFKTAQSTAKSMSFIGCSGSGKTTTLNRILATYPQVIFHEKYNFTQIVYLKIDCPHDGSLKSLCLHFFRAVDSAIGSDYERKYALKRHGVETLMHLMSQIANLHAIGLLIIDEIQHLSVNKSGGEKKMLNFFVTLVNIISLPVVMVGTPKARPIFDADFRSARRAIGFGAVLWEPIKNEKNSVSPHTQQVIKSEWVGFTDTLWKYQWLTKADLSLSEDIRECWYKLSQGIPDVVVKLFVLAQIRAIETGVERITIRLLETTYMQDMIPIHAMIEALRSGDPQRIAQYSDLSIPEVDKKLLYLQEKIRQEHGEKDDVDIYDGNSQAIRLHRLLVELGYQSDLLPNMIKRAFQSHPNTDIQTLLPVIMEWLKDENDLEKVMENDQKKALQPPRKPTIKAAAWHQLDNADLRFQYSQKDPLLSFYRHLKDHTGYVIDIEQWLRESHQHV